MLHTLAITWPGPFEMMLLAGLGLLIFGKRLPEVGRNIGKGIVEFKRGLKEAETEITSGIHSVGFRRLDLEASDQARRLLPMHVRYSPTR